MTELERIIAERDQLRTELERAQIQFGTCSVCGYVAWRERNAKTEDCQYCAVQAELERVRAQNAAALKPIVEALETAKRYCFVREAIYADSKEVIEVRPKEQIDSALSIAYSLGLTATKPEPKTKITPCPHCRSTNNAPDSLKCDDCGRDA
jgi:biotin synthase-like enzyme